jgi:hypothetical protein
MLAKLIVIMLVCYMCSVVLKGTVEYNAHSCVLIKHSLSSSFDTELIIN